MKWNQVAGVAAVAAQGIVAMSLSAQTILPPVFSEHMVVQQGKPFKVFGKDQPGQKITVTFAQQQASAVAGEDGKWQAKLTPPQAGGPYSLKIEGSSTHAFSDVLVGEVWICSGQSNMQWGVSGAANGEKEVAAANWPQIRLMNVPQVREKTPQETVKTQWVACSPQTVGSFSAVGYFFGRQLHQDLKVPVGLINSSWGGTAAEAWTPREDLLTLPGMQAVLDENNMDIPTMWNRYGADLTKWLDSFGVRNEGGAKEAAGWATTDFDDSTWKTMPLPSTWQKQGIAENAIVWFRKSVQLPADLPVDEAMLSLGGIDDFDVTFVNGVQVGKTEGNTPEFYKAPRQYTIPAGTLKPGKNVISVRVVDFGGEGGLIGPADAMQLTVGKTVHPLSGDWKYQVEQPVVIPADKPRPQMPGGNMMPTELYNAMIHPFVGYPIAGAIWYQGETNSWNAGMYRRLLPTMINAWRERWDDQFTFLIVQLAGWQKNSGEASENPNWAVFREVQQEIAQRVPNAGLAVAVDIGDVEDIHPRNKQDVGKRLALQALKVRYGKPIVASGPTIKSAKSEQGKLVLNFENIGGGLVARENDLSNNFAIGDGAGKWAWAKAEIQGDQIILSSPEIAEPKVARYAWQNTPKASLYNQEGLPAVPFQVNAQ